MEISINKRVAIVAITVGLFFLNGTPASAQEGDDQSAQVEAALRITTKAAKRYQVVVADKPCELQEKPVLRWSNPVVGNIHGNVFLWTRQSRPVAVASFFKWFSPWTHGTHEFHSLEARPLEFSLDREAVWAPQKAGIEWQPLENFADPLASMPARLIQMRRISKQFSAEKTANKTNSKSFIRLLTQPVYRYESKDNGVIDGGLFVFVEGTDPEVWLIIEARASTSKTRWEYAIARMNTTELRVRRKDQVVWKCDRVTESDARTSHRSFFKINTENLPTVDTE